MDGGCLKKKKVDVHTSCASWRLTSDARSPASPSQPQPMRTSEHPHQLARRRDGEWQPASQWEEWTLSVCAAAAAAGARRLPTFC